MFRRLVIIVLSLLAIASGLYWIDIYRPRADYNEVIIHVETIERELEEECGSGWQELSLFMPSRDLEAACVEAERLLREHSDARNALLIVQMGNAVESSRGINLGGVWFRVKKRSRYALGLSSTRLAAIAVASYRVPWNKKPEAGTNASVSLGVFSFYRGPSSEFGGTADWIHFKISIPMWTLTFLLATYPIIALIRGPIRRCRRRRRGLCVACGYNLTGLPSATCPECGAGGQVKTGEEVDAND